MGLCKEGDDYFVLTDILGDEDALGDMDFKVAGTTEGVTAIQMDIKISGIPAEVLRKALAQAKEARQLILNDMKEVMPAPRSELSVHAPQMDVLHINPEKIRDLIGPGGKNIKAITAETNADIDIEDSGKVSIFAPTLESLNKTREMVQYYDQQAEVGKNYVGTVKKILEIGAIVEILPGLEGLLHISQLDVERIAEVTDVVQLGQEITVKVVEVQPNGRIRLSRKAWLMEQAGQEVDLENSRWAQIVPEDAVTTDAAMVDVATAGAAMADVTADAAGRTLCASSDKMSLIQKSPETMFPGIFLANLYFKKFSS